MLLQIRKQRYLTNGDFQRICEMLNPYVSISIYDSLVKYYKMATKDKVLLIEEIQMPNKKRVAVCEYIKGNKIEENTILG